MPVREEYVTKRRISKTISSKTLYGKAYFSLKKDFISFLVHASLSSKAPSPFSQAIYQEKPKISQTVISTIYSIVNHKNHVYPAHLPPPCRQKKKKKRRKDPRYATRLPACELQWCICNTALQLQAGLQGQKQMAWEYSPDLGLPSVNRVVNHCHKKKADWKYKCVVLFLYQNVHSISRLLPAVFNIFSFKKFFI